ncbi:malto-oligosyltrehalose synthase [Hoyosella altamirensis]|uniref:(1->4)-alpha-D-glucan 1-alpha-D-glucosylmutase n=1 Tax=Hoyosella altamirensis TaxID=616997 RepID=A0A839RSM4_9ACTN|nr:malto-oligosyltrehalose synthase [Hoyosella altamirensis]MBB3038861.1 (1->4)-alpha-D-glucan 1-alpha-D-glucosylmutase [Hoyosella altamirensis]
MITSTYRLQLRAATALSAGFTFHDAAGLVPYLRELGVSHLYLSPFLTAVDGSAHGYDVVDPGSVAHVLGGREGLQCLADEAHAAGLGLIGDIVPNHMGVAKPASNRWWWDVLTHGRESRYAAYFDIDWDSDPEGRLRLPALGNISELEHLELDGDVLRVHGVEYPVGPGTHGGTAHAVHDRQLYRLIDWRDGPNFRRFLGINELAALRQEEKRVFEATHQLIGELTAEGVLDGVRVDHLDGLARPEQYIHWLRDLLGADKLLVVEKVIGSNEELDPQLPVDGTTGYETLREIGGVFNDPGSADALQQLAHEFTGSSWDAGAIATATRELKIAAAAGPLKPELNRVSRAVSTTESDLSATTEAIIETIAELPVYRADSSDHFAHLTSALNTVTARGAEIGAAAQKLRASLDEPEILSRFSQLSAGAMSIATEGPLAYRATRLISLLEMGGDPSRLATASDELHAFFKRTAETWPRTMTTLSTHDAKRGEDVRARISVLTQFPEQFGELARACDAVQPAPDRATGYFLLQNIIGVWPEAGPPSPALRDRLADFAVKAAREAGIRSGWGTPDSDFEDSLINWIGEICDGSSAALISSFVARISPHAHAVSLGQKLFQLAGPGIPDVYQGTEMWEDSLTDPDNRRFVSYPRFDFALRQVSRVPPSSSEPAWLTKLRLVRETLKLRRERPAAFIGGGYAPVAPDQTFVAGFSRSRPEQPPEIVAIAARFTAVRSQQDWADTTITLPAGAWTDRLTGIDHTGTVDAPTLLGTYPVALLSQS